MSSTSTMTDEVSSLKSLVSTKLWLQSNLCQATRALRQSEWKNERPKNNNAYVPTMREHLANVVTHGVLVVPSLWLSYLMISSASDTTQLFAASVYGAVLTGLFTVSTVFHSVAALSDDG